MPRVTIYCNDEDWEMIAVLKSQGWNISQLLLDAVRKEKLVLQVAENRYARILELEALLVETHIGFNQHVRTGPLTDMSWFRKLEKEALKIRKRSD